MIKVAAHLAPGLLDLHVEGHENNAEGGAACAAVSVVTQTALAVLEGLAQRWPDSIELTLHEETTT